MPVLGLGHDVVDVAAFAEQLALPGSRMRALFSVREVRQAVARAALKHDGEAVHLAAKWAGKESVLKAWCEAVGDGAPPYTLDDFPWSGVEILDDAQGRPHVALRADVERELRASLPSPRLRSPLSKDPSMGPSRSPSTEPIGGGVAASPSPALRWHVSLTHDAGVASAVALLES